MTERLDVIIFGATGFTGKYTVFEAVSVLGNFKWGVAGRNKSKLEKMLVEMGAKAKTDLTHIPIIIADVSDEKSLVTMAGQCKVVVNCCGPFRFYGETVVKACIEAGTHHVDVSGEPQYMETMQLKFNKEAEEKGVYIVSACGFDSIPADMGVCFIEQNFEGVVNSVEAYLETEFKGEPKSKTLLHYGTWESAVFALTHEGDLRNIRTQLFGSRLPKFQPILKNRFSLFRSEFGNGYCLPFPGSDRPVVIRSQRFFYEKEKKRPVQMHAYVVFRSFFTALFVALGGVAFALMTKLNFTRQLLLRYPEIFSFGLVSHEGPCEEDMERTYFTMTLKALGWPKAQELAEPSDQYTEPPSKKLIATVTGPNPGYGSTCVALLASAKMILKEHDKMPGKGGVLAPGAAFARTSLIEELGKHEHGMKFQIVK